MLDTAARTAYDADLDLFRDQVRKVFAVHLTPNLDRWEEEGAVDRDFWLAVGEAGLLCPQGPEYAGASRHMLPLTSGKLLLSVLCRTLPTDMASPVAPSCRQLACPTLIQRLSNAYPTMISA